MILNKTIKLLLGTEKSFSTKKNSANFSKNDLIQKVPVQVKGTYKEKFDNGSVSFQAELTDLINYQNSNGTIFFLVQIRDDDNYRIFYNSLLPFDLRKLINNTKKGQKTKKIKLKRFPQNYVDGISQVFNNFILNFKKQGKLLPELTSLSDIKNINIDHLELIIPVEDTSREKVFQYLLTNPVYVYAKPKGINESFVTDIITTSKISEKIEEPVTVNGEILFDYYEVLTSNDKGRTIKIGNSIFLIFKQGETTIQIKYDGTLTERIKTYKFFIAVSNKEEVLIGKLSFKAADLDIKAEDIQIAKNNLKIFLNIFEALNKLNVRTDLDLANVKKEDIDKLMYIAESITSGCQVPIVAEDSLATVFEIGNISLLLSIRCGSKKGFSYVFDYFKNENICLILDEETVLVSPYIAVDKLIIKKASNFNIDDITSSIKSYDVNELSSIKINEFCLNLLDLYDEGFFKTQQILEIIIELYEYLEKTSGESDVYNINIIQTRKRKEKLGSQDIEYLIKLKTKEVTKDYIVAANILLDSYLEAENEYNKLDEKEKEIFDKFPISNLFKKQKGRE